MLAWETIIYEGRALNWDEDLVWDTSEYPDEYYAEVMVDSMYLPEDESYNGQRTLDVTKIKYQYSWMDIEAAARSKEGRRQGFYPQGGNCSLSGYYRMDP
jgi:sulfatase modifying factor 1